MSTLGEHQGNGIRFDMHLSAPNGGVAQMLCRPDGQWVSWNEYEKLKAEVKRLQHLANQSEFYRSQLQKDTCRLENIQMQDAFKHYEAENARLKAENERLRNVGDAMADYLFDAPYPCRIFYHKWKEAKEGKQS